MTESDIGFLTILLYPTKCFGSTGATNNMYLCERYDTTAVKLEECEGVDAIGEGATAEETLGVAIAWEEAEQTAAIGMAARGVPADAAAALGQLSTIVGAEVRVGNADNASNVGVGAGMPPHSADAGASFAFP